MNWKDPFLEALGESMNYKPTHREKARLMAKIDEADSLVEAFKVMEESPYTAEFKNQLKRGIQDHRDNLPDDHEWQTAFDFIESNME